MRLEQIALEPLDGAPGIVMAQLTAGTEPCRVDVAALEPGSSLPKHPAGRSQVFYVVAGAGRVAGADDVDVPIGPGWAAFWEVGERHTSWADTAMTVLIIQRG
jgi:mannose-6-phosphate isomerase-like protein (cupin superfamily)